jgi:uncharacterized membrane protein YhaH (DUF805 family)
MMSRSHQQEELFNMDIMTAVKTCFSKYVDFSGRATRAEYWWFALFQLIVLVVTGLIHQYLYTLAALAFLLPAIAVGARRMHDIGKSGWFLLISIIPIVGLYVLYLLVQPSQAEANVYGPAPAGA